MDMSQALQEAISYKELGVFYQQGDIIMIAIDASQEQTIKRFISKGQINKNNEYVIAHGEQTGHTHTVDADKSKLTTLTTTTGYNIYKFLSVKKPAEIKHQEHKTIILPQGDYIIRNVQIYDYINEEIRPVDD